MVVDDKQELFLSSKYQGGGERRRVAVIFPRGLAVRCSHFRSLAPPGRRSWSCLHRPLLQHLRPLPDGEPDPRPMVYCRGEDLPRLVQAAASIEQVIDFGAVFGRFLDLIEIAVIRD